METFVTKNIKIKGNKQWTKLKNYIINIKK